MDKGEGGVSRKGKRKKKENNGQIKDQCTKEK
jgi:hypothetical protein